MSAVRVADVLASLSMVADLGFGLPPGEALTSCVIATGLARHLGLAESDVGDAFYTALLEHVGCVGFAHEAAALLGDELRVGAAAAVTNDSRTLDALVGFHRRATQGMPVVPRIQAVARSLRRGQAGGRELATAACEVGSATARRIGLPPGVQRGLNEVFESWAGTDGAQRLRGDDIALAARIARVSAVAARFHDMGGTDASIRAVRERSGGVLDPAIADALATHAATLLAPLDAGDPLVTVMDIEPEPHRSIPTHRLAELAAAFGDLADLKAPFLHGHSAGVERLTRDAAQRLGLAPAATARLSLAALLHDMGRIGIPDSVWERPGPLTAPQWEQVRMHPYHSERVVARSRTLAPLAPIVGMHHERLDGSGYHRGSRARDIPREARILAVADAFDAMTHPRPHRDALSPEGAAEQLRAEVRAGRLDAAATTAILASVGSTDRLRRPALPAGLTDREVEVLRAMAAGLGNREVGELLAISARTAEHHVQHVYGKIGVSSRAAAALFAMEHGLLD
ncbi:MAG: HD domain-containing phosphohydrolase [Candidatus Limnocylindrales bacterium]